MMTFSTRLFSALLRLLLCGCLLASVPAGAGLDDEVKPQSNSASNMLKFRDPKVAEEFLRREMLLARTRARAAAEELDVLGWSCCYYAASTYLQLETGEAVESAALRFAGDKIQPADMRQTLKRLSGRDMLFYEDINFTESGDTMVEWLRDNLLEGEPAMLMFGVTTPYEDGVVGHTLIAMVAGGEPIILDPAYDGLMMRASAFFERGTHWYKPQLEEPVSVIRTLRDGVDYRLRARDVRLRKYWLNDQRLELRDQLPPGQLQHNFSASQLRQAEQHQRQASGCH